MIEIVWPILHDLMPASMSDHVDIKAETLIILLTSLRQAKSVK